MAALFSKKNENTNLPEKKTEKYIRKPKFALLGPYSERTDACAKNVKLAMEELKIRDELVRVTNIKDIASYGTMQHPSLAIQGRVVSEGVLITAETAKNIIMKSGILF